LISYGLRKITRFHIGNHAVPISEFLDGNGMGVKVLLTSGYSPDLVCATDSEEVPLLSKPFRSEQLLRRIRQMLDN